MLNLAPKIVSPLLDLRSRSEIYLFAGPCACPPPHTPMIMDIMHVSPFKWRCKCSHHPVLTTFVLRTRGEEHNQLCSVWCCLLGFKFNASATARVCVPLTVWVTTIVGLHSSNSRKATKYFTYPL